MEGNKKLVSGIFARKAEKMATVGGKGYTEEQYFADAIREEAARVVAEEMQADAQRHTSFTLHAVIKTLQSELDAANSKLLHHSTVRELALETRIKELERERDHLSARLHFETTFGWFLPGAFVLAADDDGVCSCGRERVLYGAHGGAGGETAGRSHVRTCACGLRY